MALIRLLQRKPDGAIVFREPSSDPIPTYAILSHTWGKEEVTLRDMEADADRSKTTSKAGWAKIQFCADQAAADGLQYFWVDTCCIDKKNAVELSGAINSMFWWYQNAARCYAYLSDVSTSEGARGERAWEKAFRTSRWFTRGWTLQELIAPREVDFFSAEGQRLGSKLSLAAGIQEVTGIPEKALRGDTLSSFSIRERRSWAERRTTTIGEDGAYCLIGIYGVAMVLNYGEGREHAFGRLEKKIHILYKDRLLRIDFEQYAVRFSLSSFPEAAQFVAREQELSKMYELL
ncbi:HET-domain-containing protein, partial [Polyplosphaeria fusca]